MGDENDRRAALAVLLDEVGASAEGRNVADRDLGRSHRSIMAST